MVRAQAMVSRPLLVGTFVAAGVSLLLLGPSAVAGVAAGQLSLEGTPAIPCDGDSDNPEPAEQGRVPASTYDDGWPDPFTCNLALLNHTGATGGYKVHRYVDVAGTPCVFYDTTLLFPADGFNQGPDGSGVVVLDVTDPAAPVQTTALTSPAMLSPHESLILNHERGMLAAVMGAPTTYPGFIDLYDVSQDCTNPTLLSSTPVGLLGHESGMAPDGNTMYVTSPFFSTFAVIDISDATAPVNLYNGEHQSHGVTVSPDGNRAYLSPVFGVGNGRDPLYSHQELLVDGDGTGGMEIMDVSAFQAREDGAVPVFVSELTWDEVSIPQAAIHFTKDGAPYLLEIDEFVNFFDGASFLTPSGGFDERVAGAGRIIDISDETAPFVLSNLRLEVHDPQLRVSGGFLDDPGGTNPAQGYAGHYCALDSLVDPVVVACSMIMSGLRVFDITELASPVEIAHFNAVGNPGTPAINPEGAPFAMAAPAFDVDERIIWYSDTSSGLYAVQVDEAVWPEVDDVTAPVVDDNQQSQAPDDAAGSDLAATGPSAPFVTGGLLLLLSAAILRRRAA